jgi:hypothetical protein
MKRAVLFIAWRSWSGWDCTPVAFAAEIRRAAAPAAWGEAIDVPLNIA